MARNLDKPYRPIKTDRKTGEPDRVALQKIQIYPLSFQGELTKERAESAAENAIDVKMRCDGVMGTKSTLSPVAGLTTVVSAGLPGRPRRMGKQRARARTIEKDFTRENKFREYLRRRGRILARYIRGQVEKESLALIVKAGLEYPEFQREISNKDNHVMITEVISRATGQLERGRWRPLKEVFTRENVLKQADDILRGRKKFERLEMTGEVMYRKI